MGEWIGSFKGRYKHNNFETIARTSTWTSKQVSALNGHFWRIWLLKMTPTARNFLSHHLMDHNALWNLFYFPSKFMRHVSTSSEENLQSRALVLFQLKPSLLGTGLTCFSAASVVEEAFFCEHMKESDCSHDTRTGFLVTSSDSATWKYISSSSAFWPSLGSWIMNSANCFNKYGNTCKQQGNS